MSVLLLTHDHRLKEYRNRQLVDRLHRAGVEVRAVAPTAVVFHWTGEEMVVFDRAGRRLAPRLVVNALFRNEGQGLEVVQAFEHLGYSVVNRAAGWQCAKIKAMTTACLAAAGIPHPQTLFTLHSSLAVRRYVRRRLGVPLVVKPWRGALGAGVTRFRSGTRLARRLRSRPRQVYLQKFVHHPGRDIRVLVIGGRTAGATYRIARNGGWKTNVHAGARPARCDVTGELARLAVAATRAVGLDIAGVDVVENRDRLQVLEVNAWPNYRRFDDTVGIDVAGRLAGYLVGRLG